MHHLKLLVIVTHLIKEFDLYKYLQLKDLAFQAANLQIKAGWIDKQMA